MSLCRMNAGQTLCSSGNMVLAIASNFGRSFGETQYHTYEHWKSCGMHTMY